MIRRIVAPLCLTSAALAVPEGFEIREFASPPDAEYPAGITVAPNGDVYVSSDRNASLGKKEGMGRIIRCRDTDGDGRADDFVDFVPDVDSPRGGHFVGDTLYLIHPPYLSAYRDTDGDGVADEKTQLVEGFGAGIEHPRGADHTTNGVRMGIDGWLYVSVGDFGMADAVGTDGTRYTLHGGGLVRVRPDGSEMEPYAVMTRNTCDVAISPTLDFFSRDNTNDGKGWNTRFHHYTRLGDHGYPRLYKNFADEAVTPLADYGGGSGTGALWLHEPGFPGEFGDMLFSCDWTTGNVYYHPSHRDGASFRVDQKVFHELPRATDIDVDGHSRLYLADWRNGAYDYAGPDVDVGMIHQVVPTGGGEPAAYRDVTEAADAELAALLASRSGVQRLEAQREILARGPKRVFAEKIFALAGDAEAERYARVAAVFTFKQLYGEGANRYLAELAGDPVMREFALRAMTDRRGQLGDVPTEPYLKGLRADDARVVLQALIGLERLGTEGASEAILAASGDWEEGETSPRLRHTAVAALRSLAEIDTLLAALPDEGTRQLALRALKGLHRKEAVDGLLRVAGSTGDDDLRFDALVALARLHFREKSWDLESWWGTRPDDRGPYFQPEPWDASPRIREALEKGFGMIPVARQSAYLEALTRNRLPVSELDLADLDPVLAALGSEEIGKTQAVLLASAAKDEKRPAEQRLKCYDALARAPGEIAMPFRLGVLAAWSEEPDAPESFAGRIEDFVNETERGAEVAELREIAAAQADSVSRIAWKALLTVMRSPLAKEPSKDAVAREVEENPREVGFFLALADLKLGGFDEQIEVGLSADNDELIAAAERAREAVKEASGGDSRPVADVPADEVMDLVMEARGDVDAGERLFASQGCIACHAVDPDAEQKGPYLGTAGSKFTRDYLIEAVLAPNEVVAQGFQSSLFTMQDGSTHMGFVTSEADGVIEVRDIAGQVATIREEDVESRRELPQSMMPPGLANNLSIAEFTSLIEYMVSMKSEE